MTVLQGYEALQERAKLLKAHHPQEAFAAFTVGCITVLTVLCGTRALQAGIWHPGRSEYTRATRPVAGRGTLGAAALRNRAGEAYMPLRDLVELEPLPTAEDIELE